MICPNCKSELKVKTLRVGNIIACPLCNTKYIIENKITNPDKSKYWYIMLAAYFILHTLYLYYANNINPEFPSIIASIATAFVIFTLGAKYFPKYRYTIIKEISPHELSNLKFDFIFPLVILFFAIAIMLIAFIYEV